MSFSSFRLATQSFLQHDGLPFAKLLPEETVRLIAHEAGLASRVAVAEGQSLIVAAAIWARSALEILA